jgi:hypothetical protein
MWWADDESGEDLSRDGGYVLPSAHLALLCVVRPS